MKAGTFARNGRAALLISIMGIAVPFALGASLAPLIHPHLEEHPVAGVVSRPGLVLFLGVALSITAIPVLGRIMMELAITRTRLGAITMTAAAVDDAIGWILLASVAAVVRSNFDPLETLRMVGLTTGFALAMFLVVRPLVIRYFTSSLRASGGELERDGVRGAARRSLACGRGDEPDRHLRGFWRVRASERYSPIRRNYGGPHPTSCTASSPASSSRSSSPTPACGPTSAASRGSHGVADLRRRHRRGCGGQAGRLWAGSAAERL